MVADAAEVVCDRGAEDGGFGGEGVLDALSESSLEFSLREYVAAVVDLNLVGFVDYGVEVGSAGGEGALPVRVLAGEEGSFELLGVEVDVEREVVRVDV